MRSYFGLIMCGFILVSLTGCAASQHALRRAPADPTVMSDSTSESSVTTYAPKGPSAWERFKRGVDDLFTVHVDEHGAQSDFHPNANRMFNSFQRRPVLQQEYPGNLCSDCWEDVTGNPILYIPNGVDHIHLRMRLYGHPKDVWVSYEGSDHPLSATNFDFWIGSQGAWSDDYHLTTYVRYTSGQVDSSTYRVQNTFTR